MPQSFRYVVADVFTDTALEGNQLAVFTDARELPEDALQPLAREMNLSETVYVYPPAADGHARIRIFTPAVELPFAGHPVLGTAFVLAQPLQLGEILLETGLGTIGIRLERDGPKITFGWMEQRPPTVAPFDGDVVLRALGLDAAELPIVAYDNGPRFVYVAFPSEEELAALVPDLTALGRMEFAIYCFAGAGTRWKARMFFFANGVREDPATGSAAGPFAVHLARNGRIEWGDEIRISQGAEIGRPSTLFARVSGSEERVESVEVGGSAVVVARGEFRL